MSSTSVRRPPYSLSLSLSPSLPLSLSLSLLLAISISLSLSLSPWLVHRAIIILDTTTKLFRM
jgi:hypothetical protein